MQQCSANGFGPGVVRIGPRDAIDQILQFASVFEHTEVLNENLLNCSGFKTAENPQAGNRSQIFANLAPCYNARVVGSIDMPIYLRKPLLLNPS